MEIIFWSSLEPQNAIGNTGLHFNALSSHIHVHEGARGISRKVAGSRPDEMIFFFSLPNPSGFTRSWGSLSLLTEMRTRSRKITFLGSRARPVRRADNLTAICEPIV
jgi:hypothetical protein